MTDTPTRPPTHDRQWIPAADLREGDSIPCVGEVMHVEILHDSVRVQLKWAAAQCAVLALDAELWIDRWIVR